MFDFTSFLLLGEIITVKNTRIKKKIDFTINK